MSAEGSPVRNRLAFQALVLLAVVVLAYQPVWRAGFIWDDDQYITQNRTLHDLAGLRDIWLKPAATPQYYPLVLTSFWLEYHLWRLAPLGYHLVNVLLHGLGAWLLYVTLRRLRVPGAWLAAAFFALHPVQVESVAWVTERKNVLSTVLYLASALAYLRFDPLQEADSPAQRRWKWHGLALLLFAAALLSKTVTCSLPAALLVICWWKRGKVRWKDAAPLLPFFMAGACLGLVTAWTEKHHVGAEGPEWALTIAQRCLIAGRALWFYAHKLVWPTHLAFVYPRWEIHANQWRQWLYPGAALGALGALWAMRRQVGRGPLAATLVFAGTLGPALGFINVYPMRYTFVADHYQYLACIGPLALAAAAFEKVLGRFGGAKTLICALLLVLLGAMTWRQCGNYTDSETLWRATLRSTPGAPIAHNNLAQTLLDKGKPDEAIRLSEEVLGVNPKDAVAQNNLGFALLEKGRVEEAISHLRAAIAAQPKGPDSYYNLGRAFLKKGDFEAAAAQFQMALRLRPDFAHACCNLGFALLQTGRVPEAMAQYEKALALAPDYALAHNDLGSILLRLGESNRAMTHFQRAAELAPDLVEAHYNLGGVLLAAGRLDEALSQYESVAQLRPQLTEAHVMLGRLAAAYARSGRLDRAAAVAARALQLARATRETSLAETLAAQLQSYGKGR